MFSTASSGATTAGPQLPAPRTISAIAPWDPREPGYSAANQPIQCQEVALESSAQRRAVGGAGQHFGRTAGTSGHDRAGYKLHQTAPGRAGDSAEEGTSGQAGRGGQERPSGWRGEGRLERPRYTYEERYSYDERRRGNQEGKPEERYPGGGPVVVDPAGQGVNLAGGRGGDGVGPLRYSQGGAKAPNQAMAKGWGSVGNSSLCQLGAGGDRDGSARPPSHATVTGSDGRESDARENFPAHLNQTSAAAGNLAAAADPDVATARGGDTGGGIAARPHEAKRREEDLYRLLQGLQYERDQGCADVMVTLIPILLPVSQSREPCMPVS